ncbi:hypothetical protein ACE1TI_11355 [Alteribacillus sp. JSM 102045]|uniref:hypothetical protein n=1 Tax=Alteribacillus sp. JSM 102045 TaxID=1562101 RepID=UPI0035BFA9C6
MIEHRILGLGKGFLKFKAVIGFATGQVKDLIPKDIEKRKVVTSSMKETDVYIQGGTWLFNSSQELFWHHLDQIT